MPDVSFNDIKEKYSTHGVTRSIKGCEHAALSIYKAFHPEKFIQCIKKQKMEYLTIYLMYANNLVSNPLPPTELLSDGWNKQLLSEHTIIRNKVGL